MTYILKSSTYVPTMQIFENKKEITTIIKELRTCFDKINQQFMLWILETTKLKK